MDAREATDRKLRTRSLAAVGLFLLLLFPSQAQAVARVHHEDAEVVDRAELIVVGRLKKDSITAQRGEHRAILEVSEFLKGELKSETIPIVIHRDLKPVIGDDRGDGLWMNLHHDRKDAIRIIEWGSLMGGEPYVKDAGKDHLWFLWRGEDSGKTGASDLGMVDPEDVRTLIWKEYFLAYLSEDREKAVRDYLEKHPDRPGEAQKYLDHLQVQEILKLADPKVRAERLLPYYAKQQWWKRRDEAEEGMIACGEVAGPLLRRLFDEPAHRDLRYDIIRTWRKMRYEGCAEFLLRIFDVPANRSLRNEIILTWGDVGYNGCVDVLVGLLKQHDEFWSKQELEERWWHSHKNPEIDQKRSNAHGEVYYTVWALGKIGDPRARPAIELTKRRWEAIKFFNQQIVGSCEEALKALVGSR